MKDKCFILPIEIYSTEILVYIGDPRGLEERLCHYVSKTKAKEAVIDIRKTTQGRCLALEGLGTYFIWLRTPPEKADAMAVFCHEVFHLVLMIIRKVGIELTFESEEAYAYLDGFLTKAILERLTSSKKSA